MGIWKKIGLALAIAAIGVGVAAQSQTTLGELKHLSRLWDGTDVALVDGSGNLMVGDGTGAFNVIVDSSGLPTGASTSAKQDTIIGHVDGLEGFVDQLEGFVDGVEALLTTIAGAVSGAEMQVDVVTMPTTTVQATNLDVQIGGSDTVTVAATNLDVQIGGSDSLTIGTFPDNEPFNQAQVGGTAVVAGPCEREVPIVVMINQTSGTQLITGTASERVYVCSLNLITASAQNIALVSGTGTVCATSTGPMAGGTTAATGWNLAANGGLVWPASASFYTKTDTDADNVCILQSASGQISGSLTYVSIPNI